MDGSADQPVEEATLNKPHPGAEDEESPPIGQLGCDDTQDSDVEESSTTPSAKSVRFLKLPSKWKSTLDAAGVFYIGCKGVRQDKSTLQGDGSNDITSANETQLQNTNATVTESDEIPASQCQMTSVEPVRQFTALSPHDAFLQTLVIESKTVPLSETQVPFVQPVKQFMEISGDVLVTDIQMTPEQIVEIGTSDQIIHKSEEVADSLYAAQCSSAALAEVESESLEHCVEAGTEPNLIQSVEHTSETERDCVIMRETVDELVHFRGEGTKILMTTGSISPSLIVEKPVTLRLKASRKANPLPTASNSLTKGQVLEDQGVDETAYVGERVNEVLNEGASCTHDRVSDKLESSSSRHDRKTRSVEYMEVSQELNISVAENHVTEHEEELEERHQCTDCQDVFSTQILLKDHLETHTVAAKNAKFPRNVNQVDPSGINSTDSGETASMPIAEDSDRNTTTKRQYICKYCDKVYKLKGAYEKHSASHARSPKRDLESEQLGKCKKCGKSFASRHALVLHMKTHKVAENTEVNVKSESCDDKSQELVQESCSKDLEDNRDIIESCSKGSEDAGDISESCSKDLEDPGDVRKEEEDPGAYFPFRCKVCSSGFDDHMEYIEHLEMHLSPQTNQNEDAVSFSSSMFVDPSEGKVRKVTTNFSCKTAKTVKAGSVAKNVKAIGTVNKKKGVNGDKSVGTVKTVGTVKGVKTVNKSKGVNTGKTVGDVNKVKALKCSHCTRVFSCIADRSFHLSSVKKLEKCSHCEESFGFWQELKEHISVVHLNVTDKPEHCKICDETFVYPGTLKIHNRHHELEKKRINCVVCSKEFITQQGLKVHQRVHYVERPFKCSLCERSYISKHNFDDHVLTHSDEKPFKCDVCDASFQLEHRLKRHSLTHLETQEFECKRCGKCFFSRQRLRRHELAHDAAKKHVCSVCQKTYDRKDRLLLHQTVHTGDKPYACIKCGHKFSTPYRLEVHRRIHFQEKKPLKCNYCEESFQTNSLLDKHTFTHLPENEFQCHCGKTFISKNSLRRHELSVHRDQNHKCQQCDKAFTHKAKLTTHMRVHTGEKPFECSICKGKFRSNTSLQSHHQLLHSTKKAFKCDHCIEQFKTQAKLDRHVVVHEPNINFKCHCGKAFYSKARLKRHERTHTQEKKQQCATCGKCFARKRYLKIHEMIHSGEKPHTCPYCGKSYRFETQLRDHESVHTGELRHKCEVCGKAYRYAADFHYHRSTHTSDPKKKPPQKYKPGSRKKRTKTAAVGVSSSANPDEVNVETDDGLFYAPVPQYKPKSKKKRTKTAAVAVSSSANPDVVELETDDGLFYAPVPAIPVHMVEVKTEYEAL